MQFLSHLPEWITTVVVAVPLIAAGGLAVLGIVNKQANERQKMRQQEADNLADRVRNLYKDESDAQNEKIKNQETQLKDLGTRLATLEGENKTFRSLLTGTDEQSKSYRNRVEASLTLVDKLSQIIVMNGQKTDKISIDQSNGFKTINANIERLAKAIEKNGKGV